MTTLDIRDLFEAVSVALKPLKLIEQYVFAPAQDINASVKYNFPLLFVDNQIFVSRIGNDPTKIPMQMFDVGLRWVDVAMSNGNTGEGDRRFEVDVNIKPRIEIVWAAVWGVLIANVETQQIWADPLDGYTMTPIEYESGDGVCGYYIEFKLYGHPSATKCDFTGLVGELVKKCQL